MLKPVKKQLSVDNVFCQMRDLIIQNEFEIGSYLPAERQLSEAFDVNRSVVREAMKRLEQMRLISIQQGERTKVVDYRREAGLELLPSLAILPDRSIDPIAVRSLMEMMHIVCRDIANHASQRRTKEVLEKLEDSVKKMGQIEDLIELEKLVDQFWSDLIDASENIAYRMAFNSIYSTYEYIRPLVRKVFEQETRNLTAYKKLLKAVKDQKPRQAEKAVEDLLKTSSALMAKVSNNSEINLDDSDNKK